MQSTIKDVMTTIMIPYSVAFLNRKSELDNGERPEKVTVRSEESSSITLGSNTCLFCNAIDNPEHLVAAGTMHASSAR